jgi:predicted RND superfamily exporter protein
MENRGKAFDPHRVSKRSGKVSERGLRVESFEPGLRALREMLSTGSCWPGKAKRHLKTIANLSEEGGDSYLSVAYVHLRPGFWGHAQANDFLSALGGSNPAVSVTSSKLVQMELEELMTRESWRILLLALAAVSLLIYSDFRSWTLTFISLLPVVLASLWTLGIMGILGIHLNFMNLVVFTMVLGIGVDYGVHLLHRGLQSSPENLGVELERVNRGVVLAALTTLAGFGSLIFSAYPGLKSMGVVALMGVGFSLLLALTLVPVLFHKWLGRANP